jgi:hypothetical protein
MKPRRLSWLFLSTAAVLLAGCSLPGAAVLPPTQTPFVVNIVVTATPSLPTATPPQPVPSPTAVASAGPRCVVQKKVNLRSGPGTDFAPPVGSFEAGKALVPQGYNPSGFPGGTWLQVLDPQAKLVGWVSAEAEFVQCSVDLTTLPSVAVAAPALALPEVSNKPPEGPPSDVFGFFPHLSPEYLMAIETYDKGSGGTKDGDGIAHVHFSIRELKADGSGSELYQKDEGTAKYCIFGGGEPKCNPWPRQDGKLVWGTGGAEVKKGDYQAVIDVYTTSDPSHANTWEFTITVAP